MQGAAPWLLLLVLHGARSGPACEELGGWRRVCDVPGDDCSVEAIARRLSDLFLSLPHSNASLTNRSATAPGAPAIEGAQRLLAELAAGFHAADRARGARSSRGPHRAGSSPRLPRWTRRHMTGGGRPLAPLFPTKEGKEMWESLKNGMTNALFPPNSKSEDEEDEEGDMPPTYVRCTPPAPRRI